MGNVWGLDTSLMWSEGKWEVVRKCEKCTTSCLAV